MGSTMRMVRQDRQREAEVEARTANPGRGRRATDYSLEACATVIGVAKPTYLRFEKDPGLMRVWQAKRLAEHLGVSLEAVVS